MTTPDLDPEFAHLSDFDVGFADDAIDLGDIRASLEGLLQTPSSDADTLSRHFVIREEPSLGIEAFSPVRDGPSACLLWFHGGGYMIGSALMDAACLHEWSRRFRCTTISVEYRLAPEHPFPAGHDDARRALQWVREHAEEMDIDPARILVGGASAGGGLAAALALSASDDGIALAGQLLFYPMLDDRLQTASSQWDAAIWPPSANQLGWRSYLGGLFGGDVPASAAPARASSLRGLPATMLLVGGADGFLDEDLEYARRLTHAGVPTEIRVFAGAPHGFDLMVPGARASMAARRDPDWWLEEHTSLRPGSSRDRGGAN